MDGVLRMQVLLRDQGRCLAPILDPAEPATICTNLDGTWPKPYDAKLTVDHVRPDVPHGQLAKPQGVGGFGKRPADRMANLATLCHYHHQGQVAGHVWATAHRPLLRAYLAARAEGLGYWDAVAAARLHVEEE